MSAYERAETARELSTVSFHEKKSSEKFYSQENEAARGNLSMIKCLPKEIPQIKWKTFILLVFLNMMNFARGGKTKKKR